MSRTKSSTTINRVTDVADVAEARAALASAAIRKAEATDAVAAARRQLDLHSPNSQPVKLRVEARQCEHDLAQVNLDEHDARMRLTRALFAQEVDDGDADAVLVFGLFDKLAALGEQAADLATTLGRVHADARAACSASFDAHARLNQRRAAAGDPLAPKPNDNAAAFVSFLQRVQPAARTNRAFDQAMGSQIDKLEEATFDDKARAFITGVVRPRGSLAHALHSAERALFDAQRDAMHAEQEAAKEAEEQAQIARAHEDEKRAEARRIAASAAESAKRRAELEAERQTITKWAATKRGAL